MKSKQNSLHKALAFLEEEVRNGKWKNGHRIPTIAHLAQFARVSTNTMALAITMFKQKKILTVYKKKGIFYGKPAPAFNPQKNVIHEPKAEILRKKIAHDILNGVFDNPEQLPSYKELSFRYGAGYRTLRTACKLLVHDQVIVSYKKGFYVKSYRLSEKHNTLFFISAPNFFNDFERNYFPSRFLPFLFNLEKECAARHIRLVRQNYETRFTSTNSFATALGFCLWISYAIVDIVNTLLQYKRPIFIIQLTNDEPKICLPVSHNIHIFRINDYNAGYTVGKYLLASGHRKIAYWTNFHESPWSQARYRGLKAAYKSVGFSNSSVYHFATDTEKSDEIANRLMSARQSMKQIWPAIIAPVHSATQSAISHKTGNWLMERLVLRANEFQGIIAMQTATCSEVLKEMVAIPGLSAIVALDDNLAVYGTMDLMTGLKKRVPLDISIIGFNNQIEAFHYHLSSYDFNFSGMLQRMFSHLMGPQKKRSGHRGPDGPHDIEGFLAIRSSTMERR